MIDIPILMVVLLTSLCTGALALSLIARFGGEQGQASGPTEATAFLFDGLELLDATVPATELLAMGEDLTDWDRLHRGLHGRFPELAENPDDQIEGSFPSRLPDDRAELRVERKGPRVRIEVIGDGANPMVEPPCNAFDHLHFGHKHIADHAPSPIWAMTDTGTLVWANRAYRALAQRVAGDPMAKVFPFDPDPVSDTQRIELEGPQGETSWFEITECEADGQRLFFASNIDSVAQAEKTQRDFVQTLAKTFAHLSTGLAIFDRDRQLVLFNPALIDLTSLNAEFLSARPTLLSFFDELRIRQRMPEPKNYQSWRHKIADLVSAATDGHYSETWMLDTGQTYRVSGRPHPNGAIAFLFEDISAEVSLNRRFREDIELSQAVVDALPDPLAVFSFNKTLSTCNTAFREQWGIDPEAAFAAVSLNDCIQIWQEHCDPTPFWGELRDFADESRERAEWSGRVSLQDGGALEFLVAPLVGGAFSVLVTRQDSRNALADDPEQKMPHSR